MEKVFPCWQFAANAEAKIASNEMFYISSFFLLLYYFFFHLFTRIQLLNC